MYCFRRKGRTDSFGDSERIAGANDHSEEWGESNKGINTEPSGRAAFLLSIIPAPDRRISRKKHKKTGGNRLFVLRNRLL